MGPRPCPKCGSVKWWWRDETGCSQCIKSENDPANKTMTLLIKKEIKCHLTK
jgi:5-methylcytosine-specific restriction endonuclease McrA